jgi:hypothetical protein
MLPAVVEDVREDLDGCRVLALTKAVRHLVTEQG